MLASYKAIGIIGGELGGLEVKLRFKPGMQSSIIIA
jgi:hypothetical protein